MRPTALACRSNQQMHMVGHETIRVQEKREFHLLRGEQRQELFVVCGSVEDLPSVIAPSDHVIETTLNLRSRFAGHKDADANTRAAQASNNRLIGVRTKDFGQRCE